MKKILLIALGLTCSVFMSLPVYGQGGRQSNSPVIVERSGNEINPKVLEYDGGRFKYSMDGKGFLMKNRGEVKYAWVPRPREVRRGAGLFIASASLRMLIEYVFFLKAAGSTSFFLWEQCRYAVER